ncbi:MAG: hypothetical protein K2X93_19280 [Candidatus Obscuribacterales bacterium]|nr:hypothetical protein [Candidatus Obscuribacterales bacterium]
MSSTCPYCGAKLNLGLKFCVVCGRHVAHESMGKVGGGLRGGFRPADITRRLDELITVARFRKSRRSHDFERGSRFVFVNGVYLFVATGLFYAALQFTLETVFPGKFTETRVPIDKIRQFVHEKTAGMPQIQQLTNTNQVVIVNPPKVTPGAAADTKSPQGQKAASKKAKKKKKKSKVSSKG